MWLYCGPLLQGNLISQHVCLPHTDLLTFKGCVTIMYETPQQQLPNYFFHVFYGPLFFLTLMFSTTFCSPHSHNCSKDWPEYISSEGHGRGGGEWIHLVSLNDVHLKACSSCLISSRTTVLLFGCFKIKLENKALCDAAMCLQAKAQNIKTQLNKSKWNA